MKNIKNAKILFAGLLAVSIFHACKKDKNHAPAEVFNVNQVNLVADTAGMGATLIDINLKNAWGLTANPTGIAWISANHEGVSTVYGNTGATVRPPVTIPAATAGGVGSPTGIIFNGTPDFGGNKFIFASEDGIVTAWAAGNVAVKVATSATSGVYKGLAIAAVGADNFLYMTDFKGGKIDVLDKNFNYVTDKHFADPAIPAGFAPFNIQNLNGQLYVTYAKQKGPDNMDDDAAPGNGFVDIFNPDGTLVKRFASQGTLNSPWGIVLAPAGFAGNQPVILVGNFGDGHINVFDTSGKYKGQLESNGHAIAIDGLWALDFLKGNPSTATASDRLYFTAGPGDESHGLFGYLQKQ